MGYLMDRNLHNQSLEPTRLKAGYEVSFPGRHQFTAPCWGVEHILHDQRGEDFWQLGLAPPDNGSAYLPRPLLVFLGDLLLK